MTVAVAIRCEDSSGSKIVTAVGHAAAGLELTGVTDTILSLTGALFALRRLIAVRTDMVTLSVGG